MITKQDNFTDVVVGGAKSQEFTIDTESSVIFEILRDKMYKDKIGAIAREVASNSRDANREVDSDKPVEIRIITPNPLLGIGHESISFKDYGKGIPPNKMSDIYLKYGASDKRTTNKLTGGFGLGAKTPFAYNDTFTVLTVADFEGERKEYKYTAMLDTSGKGKMVLFSEELSEKETGTEIIVPIKNRTDRGEFETKVLKYTKTWGDEVTYINFNQTQEELETIYEEEGFNLYFSERYLYGEKMEMIIDGIPYPMDNSILQLTNTINTSHFLTVLKFNTGELSISANRESVQYDEETITLIKERYNEFQSFMNTKLETLIEKEKTYLEACIMTYNIRKSSMKRSQTVISTEMKAMLAHAQGANVSLKNPTWRGIPTVDRVIFRHHTVHYVTLENGKNKYTLQDSIELYSDIVNKTMVYGDTRKSASRNANLWEDGKSSFYLITPKDKDSKEGIEEIMNFIFKLDIDFKLYTDLEPLKAESGVKGVYVKKSYVTLNIRSVDHYDIFSPDTIEIERKSFEEASGEDLSKYVYDKVRKLAYNEAAKRQKLRFLKDRGYTPIIVREQDYENWFSKTPMVHVNDVYDAEYAAWKVEVLQKKKEIVLNQLIIKVREQFIADEYFTLVKDALPKSARCERPTEDVTYREVDLVKPTLKYDFKGLKEKLRRIFEERYPLMKTIQNSWHLPSGTSKKQQIELYIKQVNNYYGN